MTVTKKTALRPVSHVPAARPAQQGGRREAVPPSRVMGEEAGRLPAHL